MKVYLAGYMSGEKLDECTRWRNELKASKGLDHVIWIDPFDGENLSSITSDGLKSDIPGRLLYFRDYNSVKLADLVVANLNTFGNPRPSVGTFFEVAWAYEWKKPVIAITDNDNYRFHPFIENSCYVTDSMDEVRRLLLYYSKIFNGGERNTKT